jgi:hypothetical protein
VRRFDVFNGDADGICALRQLRLAHPAEATLVTGLKHDIALLDRVDAGPGDEVTVLDVSLERNRADLARLLARGAAVRWFDHHDPGEVPSHANLRATIDATGVACTSELVDRFLGGRHRAWAVAGAFGDGLREAAHGLAGGLGLDAGCLDRLRTLGEALNYNAYGATLADVLVPPDELYRRAARYADPLSFAESEPVIAELTRACELDLEQARRVPAARSTAGLDVHRLPDARWARRVQGAFANALAREDPVRAYAVLVPLGDGDCAVSVRVAPGREPTAARFCRGFPGGGGRATAAGVGRLDASGVEAFLEALERAYGLPWRKEAPARARTMGS